MPKRSSGGEETKVSDDLKAGNVVTNIKAASVNNDDSIWNGVDVDDASVKTEKEATEGEKDDDEEDKDESTNDDVWLLPSHKSFLIYLASGAGALTFLAFVGSFICKTSVGGEESARLNSGFRDSAL